MVVSVGVVSRLGVKPIAIVYPGEGTIKENIYVAPPQIIEVATEDGERTLLVEVIESPLPSYSKEIPLEEEKEEEEEEYDAKDTSLEGGNDQRENFKHDLAKAEQKEIFESTKRQTAI